MSYLDMRRFDIDEYVNKAVKLDYLELMTDIDKQLEVLSHTRMPKDNDKYTVKYFLDFLIRLRNCLDGLPVSGLSSFDKNKIKMVVQSLVDKDQLLPAILKGFE